MSDKKIMKKRYNTIVITLLFVSTGFMIFKNNLFFNRNALITFQIDENIMAAYENQGSFFSPLDGSTIYLHDFDINGNEIIIKFNDSLYEDTVFYLYNSSSDVDQYIIEQKTVRKGYDKISFYFESMHLDTLKILAISYDGSHYVNIPTGTIGIYSRYVDVLQKNKDYIILSAMIFIASIFLAIIISRQKVKDIEIYKNSRSSNIELLRIVCMLFLVAHHYAVHGGLLNLDFSLPKYVGLVFLPVGKICFIAFIAISMFFLVDGKSKFDRFSKCWLEVAFYSISLTIMTWCLGGRVRLRDLLSSFFVMISNSHGFAASYLLFLLIYPFILKATKGCSKKQARYLLFVTFWIQIMSQIMRAWTGYNQPVYSELLLFVFCYVLSMNLKKYPIRILDNKLFDLFIVLSVYASVYAINIAAYKGKLNSFTSFLHGITGDESSIFFVLGGYALFYLFKNIHIPHNKIINTIAAGTFGILLIHDHNFFRHMFWNEVIRTQTYFHSKYFIVYYLITVFLIFMACSVIDYIRRKLLEEKIINTRIFNTVKDKMNQLLNS